MITVNKDARTLAIEAETKRCISFIESNANKGIATTELYIPKYIGSSVRDAIEKQFDMDGTDYTFQIVRRSPNQFTGQMQSFTGDTIGDEKYYKIYIRS